MKKSVLLFLFLSVLYSCSTDKIAELVDADDEAMENQDTDSDDDTDDNTDSDENSGDDNGDFDFTDSFDTDGDLIDYVTNNATSLPNVASVSGRYKATVDDNTNNVTLHFNMDQGRIDAKLVEFPFEFIARNIGIGTLEDSQMAPVPNNGPYIFSGVQVHVKDFNSINSSHVVVGHRGNTGYTIEGKNTVDGDSSVNDIGANTAPDGRADIRIVGNDDNTLTVYWQTPNLNYETAADDWTLYRDTGNLPGVAPDYDSEVYVGLITYAFGQNGVPFVGTCDAVQITD